MGLTLDDERQIELLKGAIWDGYRLGYISKSKRDQFLREVDDMVSRINEEEKQQTWEGIYLKMSEDILRVQRENWEKVECAIAHAISTYDEDRRRIHEATQGKARQD